MEEAVGRWRQRVAEPKGQDKHWQEFTYTPKNKKGKIGQLLKGGHFPPQSPAGLMSDSKQTVLESLVNTAKHLRNI